VGPCARKAFPFGGCAIESWDGACRSLIEGFLFFFSPFNIVRLYLLEPYAMVDRSICMYVAIDHKGQAGPNNFVDQEARKDQTTQVVRVLPPCRFPTKEPLFLKLLPNDPSSSQFLPAHPHSFILLHWVTRFLMTSLTSVPNSSVPTMASGVKWR
jgi:hypothetical protein